MNKQPILVSDILLTALAPMTWGTTYYVATEFLPPNHPLMAAALRLFGTVGAAFEIAAILTAIILTFLVRNRGSTFYWTLGGAILLVLAFVSWIVFVAPMNAEFAKWLTNPIPADWTRYRVQWEYGHAVNAVIKIIAVGLLATSVLIETPQKFDRHI